MIPRACCSLLQPQVARKYLNRIAYLVKGSRAFSRCSPWCDGGETMLCHPSAPPRVISIATLLYEPQTSYSREVQNSPVVVTVNGWIKSHRSMKKYSFLHLTDGTTTKPLQAVIPKEGFEVAKVLTTGTCIRITGEWRSSPGSMQNHQEKELYYHSLEILGYADPETYPLQKKYHTTEFLRSMLHLRPRVPTQTAFLQLRSWVISRISTFFVEADFVQVHPPIITSSDCEGAGEVFTVSNTTPSTFEERVSVVQAASEPTPLSQKQEDHFFRAPKYLTVSSQLHLECLAHTVPRVWTLSPTFRAEKSDTNRHLSEFYMLEAEISFVNKLEDIMAVVEEMTRYVVSGLINTRVGNEIIEMHANRLAETTTTNSQDDTDGKLKMRWESLLTAQPWTRMTYTEAIEHLLQAVARGEEKFVFEPQWGNALQAEHERFLVVKFGVLGPDGGGGPVFVTHYPAAIKPFYMLPSTLDGASNTVACFDLLFPHVGELVGGSLREHRYRDLVERMSQLGLISPGMKDEDSGVLEWYAELRKWGSVPHGGFGMGFDRLLAYLAGAKDVREIVGFPRWKGRCDC